MNTSLLPAVAPAKKSPHALRLLLLTSLSAFPAGCVRLAVEDSSHSPVFASMIGQEFELKEELLVRGVKWNSRSTGPDYLLVMPPPGIGGRFTMDFGKLPAGSRFRIVGVVTRQSKLFPSTRYVIALMDHQIGQAENKEIRITDTSKERLYVEPDDPDQPPQLSERFFRRLEDATGMKNLFHE